MFDASCRVALRHHRCCVTTMWSALPWARIMVICSNLHNSVDSQISPQSAHELLSRHPLAVFMLTNLQSACSQQFEFRLNVNNVLHRSFLVAQLDAIDPDAFVHGRWAVRVVSGSMSQPVACCGLHRGCTGKGRRHFLGCMRPCLMSLHACPELPANSGHRILQPCLAP